MADIARVFSPVVVFPSGEARPQSSGRVRSASTRRISSGSTRPPSRVSSAVSTIEDESNTRSRFMSSDVKDEKVLQAEIQEELTTPLTGIDLLGLINDKISKLDQALRSVEAPSDFKKNKALITSEKLRAEAVQTGKSRHQVQQFAGILAIKSTFQDQILTTVKTKSNSRTAIEQDQSTLLEIFQYPGFEEDRITPLPFDVSLQVQVMQRILPRRYLHSQQAPHIKSLIQLYHSSPTQALIMDIFWWVFLEFYQSQPKTQKRLLDRASNSYVALLMMEIDLRYRDRCFQIYPSLIAETVFACFKVCFPASIKQMPLDAEAAGKVDVETKENRLDLGNLSDTPGQRMKELVNLDTFKNSISNVCQMWLGGIPAPPRRYEHWKSKLVQQEKITFVEPDTTASITGTITSNTATNSTNTSGPTLNTAPSGRTNLNGSQINAAKPSVVDGNRIVTMPASAKINKRKQPHDLLAEMYKHTNDPIPDRRIYYEDYQFDLNGYSPLTERFLRSSHMLRRSGTQLFIPHPQISHMPSVNSESYGNEIKRAARICRLVRAQKHLEQEAEKVRRNRIFGKQRVNTSKTRDEFNKEQTRESIYRRRFMNSSTLDIASASQYSMKSTH